MERPQTSETGRTDGFACEVEPDREIARVVPRGELDLFTVPRVDGCLTEVHGVGFRNLVLDLRQLTFIDSRGVHLVERWAGAATNGSFSFSVIAGVESVHRVFELTDTADSLPFDGSPKRAGARGG